MMKLRKKFQKLNVSWLKDICQIFCIRSQDIMHKTSGNHMQREMFCKNLLFCCWCCSFDINVKSHNLKMGSRCVINWTKYCTLNGAVIFHKGHLQESWPECSFLYPDEKFVKNLILLWKSQIELPGRKTIFFKLTTKHLSISIVRVSNSECPPSLSGGSTRTCFTCRSPPMCNDGFKHNFQFTGNRLTKLG